MTQRVSILALATLGSALSLAVATPAQAEDECTKLIIYAVKQFCQLMPNGQSLCQPVALTGPSPACQVPTPGQIKPVPLAPPTVQFPMATPYSSPSSFPFPAMPSVMPAAPYNPYLASPMTAQPVSPFGTSPMPFMMPPAATAPASPAAPSAGTPPAAPPVTAQATAPGEQSPAPAPIVPMAPTAAPPAAMSPASPISPATSTTAAETTSFAPEAVTPNLPDAPSLPPVVAEAVALFAFDSAQLNPVGQQTLDSWLVSAPVGMPVVVYGHADRLGPEDYNLELSQRRADTARMYLISKGKDPRDIRSVGRGEAEPVKNCKGGATDATKACLAPNRRVLITHD